MPNQKTILIAEDDLSLQEMYRMRLEADGYKVTTASDGSEALESISQNKPDLILLDLIMPKLNGFDVLNNLKKNPETKDIPIIVLTALIQEVTKAKSLMSGADDYLMKSEVTPAEVAKKVKEVLIKQAKN